MEPNQIAGKLKQMDITQRQLADASGLSEQVISSVIKNGNPRYNTMQAITKGFKIIEKQRGAKK